MRGWGENSKENLEARGGGSLGEIGGKMRTSTRLGCKFGFTEKAGSQCFIQLM